MPSCDPVLANSASYTDAAVTTTAHDVTMTLVSNKSLVCFVRAKVRAPATNGDLIYFRINGPTADATNGIVLAPGETKDVEYLKTLSVVAASGTQTVVVEGKG